MINFRFLVNAKNIKIQRGIQPSMRIVEVLINIVSTFGQLLYGSVNLKKQGEVLPLTDSDCFCARSFKFIK